MSVFYTHKQVFCPVCPARFHRKNPERRVGVTMDCVESNYSGCMIDIAECTECGKTFQVSYKVDKISEFV
jgi:hypothetical protein